MGTPNPKARKPRKILTPDERKAAREKLVKIRAGRAVRALVGLVKIVPSHEVNGRDLAEIDRYEMVRGIWSALNLRDSKEFDKDQLGDIVAVMNRYVGGEFEYRLTADGSVQMFKINRQQVGRDGQPIVKPEPGKTGAAA